MTSDWLDRIFADKDLLRMGHVQRAEDRNLGLGWVYYALARLYRPRCAVCIGSYRGFVPMTIARGMADNSEGGELHFIDPSFVDDHWKDPAQVKAWFAGFDLHNIRHHRATTQEFAQSDAFDALGTVDMLFVDGMHTEEQARFDHETFLPKMGPEALALFHDSLTERSSTIYGEGNPYHYSVRRYLDTLEADAAWQLFDFPFADGFTMVRRAGKTPIKGTRG